MSKIITNIADEISDSMEPAMNDIIAQHKEVLKENWGDRSTGDFEFSFNYLLKKAGKMGTIILKDWFGKFIEEYDKLEDKPPEHHTGHPIIEILFDEIQTEGGNPGLPNINDAGKAFQMNQKIKIPAKMNYK